MTEGTCKTALRAEKPILQNHIKSKFDGTEKKKITRELKPTIYVKSNYLTNILKVAHKVADQNIRNNEYYFHKSEFHIVCS